MKPQAVTTWGISLSIGLLLMLVPAAARALPAPDDALIDQASEKLSAGDLDGALAILARAQTAAPKDPRARYLRGAALQQKKDYDGAERAFKEALTMDPHLGDVRSELGALYLDRGRAKDAIIELTRAVVDSPHLQAAWQNLGAAEVGQKDCVKGIAAYQHAVDCAEHDAIADALVDLSLAQRRCGQPPASLQTAQKAVATQRGSANAHLNLGLALSTVGKKEDAIKELAQSTQIDGRNPVAWWSLGLTQREANHLADAATSLGHAVQLAPTQRHSLAYAETLVAIGKCAEAKSAAAALTGDAKAAAAKKLAACVVAK